MFLPLSQVHMVLLSNLFSISLLSKGYQGFYPGGKAV